MPCRGCGFLLGRGRGREESNPVKAFLSSHLFICQLSGLLYNGSGETAPTYLTVPTSKFPEEKMTFRG